MCLINNKEHAASPHLVCGIKRPNWNVLFLLARTLGRIRHCLATTLADISKGRAVALFIMGCSGYWLSPLPLGSKLTDTDNILLDNEQPGPGEDFLQGAPDFVTSGLLVFKWRREEEIFIQTDFSHSVPKSEPEGIRFPLCCDTFSDHSAVFRLFSTFNMSRSWLQRLLKMVNYCFWPANRWSRFL